jgi:hypothetical protein
VTPRFVIGDIVSVDGHRGIWRVLSVIEYFEVLIVTPADDESRQNMDKIGTVPATLSIVYPQACVRIDLAFAAAVHKARSQA